MLKFFTPKATNMGLRKKFHFVLYRIRERGLEVFLLSRENEEWQIPVGQLNKNCHNDLVNEDKLIDLDSIAPEQEDAIKHACAIEGDWHDIPSLKCMLKEDINEVKDKLEEIIPELEKGTFVAVKDALKKVMPSQYEFLKELKDIITDRNSVNGI